MSKNAAIIKMTDHGYLEGHARYLADVADADGYAVADGVLIGCTDGSYFVGFGRHIRAL